MNDFQKIIKKVIKEIDKLEELIYSTDTTEERAQIREKITDLELELKNLRNF